MPQADELASQIRSLNDERERWAQKAAAGEATIKKLQEVGAHTHTCTHTYTHARATHTGARACARAYRLTRSWGGNH